MHVRGRTLSGLTHPLWNQAALNVRDLKDIDRRLEISALAGIKLGPRLAVSDFDSEALADESQELRLRVEAYRVPCVVGARFEMRQLTDIGGGLRAVLSQYLPGVDWYVKEDVWEPAFRKLGIVHESFVVPSHPHTGEALALELFAEADSQFMHARDSRAWKDAIWGEPGACAVALPAWVTVKSAVLSNLMYPGVDVPFYM